MNKKWPVPLVVA